MNSIWARTAFDPITLDGVLNEPEWAQAETHVIEYAVDAGMPGSGWKTEEVWLWKFETFIFDIFPYAESFKVIVGDRKKCFAPLKNLSGPETLRQTQFR